MRATDDKNAGDRKGRTRRMQDSVGVVKDVYEAFGRGDVPAIFGLFHPEAEVYQSSRLPWGGEYRGHEELGVEEAENAGDIPSSESVVDASHNRHVILRHSVAPSVGPSARWLALH